MIENETYPLALTIAGSDSGGGAGIQADLRTFSSFGVFGASVITAVTAQNHTSVSGIEILSPEIVARQIDAVFSELNVKTVKIGMIPDLKSAEIISCALKKYQGPEIIIDTVMTASTGTPLMKKEVLEFNSENLFLLSDWITPNRIEAEQILNKKLNSAQKLIDASAEISEKYNCITIIKGGDSDSETADDYMCINNSVYKLSSEKITRNNLSFKNFSHGTGCTFSSALAACRALGMHWKDTVISAKAFVLGSLCETVQIGKGTTAMYPPAASYRNKISVKKL
jgi:hydroxymethylpyrimidine/phosphomethylpyrimidine kinase